MGGLLAVECVFCIHTAAFVAATEGWGRFLGVVLHLIVLRGGTLALLLTRRGWVCTWILWKTDITAGEVLARKVGLANGLFNLATGYAFAFRITHASGCDGQVGFTRAWLYIFLTGQFAQVATVQACAGGRWGRWLFAHELVWTLYPDALSIRIAEFLCHGLRWECRSIGLAFTFMGSDPWVTGFTAFFVLTASDATIQLRRLVHGHAVQGAVAHM